MDFAILLEPHLLALIISLTTTWGATEYLKRILRTQHTGNNNWAPRLISFLIGVGMGTTTWPNDTEVEPIVFGIAVGVAAPMLHTAFILFIKWKWPELAKRVTGAATNIPPE